MTSRLGSFIDIKAPETAFSVELQHLFRSRYLNLQTGGGSIGVDSKEDLTIVSPGSEPFRSVTDLDLQHFNAYAYAYVNLLKNLNATLGLSFDSLSGDEDVDKDQVNPKFGITWTPFAGTTLRAAAFRVLKRTLITDQTVEPTQVAGFNQFFDDVPLTEAWRYGGAIDQKFTTSLFGGVEFSKRDLTVPTLDVTDPFNPVNRDVDANEYLGRAYLFWTPHRWLALRAQYIFERFKRETTIFEFTELDTQRVPLGIGFFHPSGLSASLTATYWDQDGTFTPFLDPTVPLRSGSDDFWTVDAALSYRLPKRYGFISVGATNLFDEEFNFFEVDFDNPTIAADPDGLRKGHAGVSIGIGKSCVSKGDAGHTGTEIRRGRLDDRKALHVTPWSRIASVSSSGGSQTGGESWAMRTWRRCDTLWDQGKAEGS